jgi:PiT family inorganic phosphate transporter
MIELILPVGLGVFLSFGNGANDNFKGVATLYGSGALPYRRALHLATVSQIAGSLTALILAQGLVAAFSGKGLVPAQVLQLSDFPLAVSLAAAITVFLATQLGFPISTTHALTGGLVGAGLAASPEGVDLTQLGGTFILPLIVSPVIAFLISIIVTHFTKKLPMHPFMMGAHTASAVSVCFARALNDTPKVAALILASRALSPSLTLILVSLSMAIGGILSARRVADTLSKKAVQMSEKEGLSANLVTGILVLFASKLGMPVSTTHVSGGSIFGVGMVTGNADRSTIRGILLAWIITLPVATLVAYLGFKALQSI